MSCRGASAEIAPSALAEMMLTSAEMKLLGCVGCWSNRDEVVGMVIMDHRLLLGESSFVVAPYEGCNIAGQGLKKRTKYILNSEIFSRRRSQTNVR